MRSEMCQYRMQTLVDHSGAVFTASSRTAAAASHSAAVATHRDVRRKASCCRDMVCRIPVVKMAWLSIKMGVREQVQRHGKDAMM